MLRNRLLLAAVFLVVSGMLLCPRLPNDAKLASNILEAALTVDRHGDTSSSRRLLEEAVLSNYTPIIEGEDVISGRLTWSLRLKPMQKRFPWKQIWIDRHTSAIVAYKDWSSRNIVKSSWKLSSSRPMADAGKDLRFRAIDKLPFRTKTAAFPTPRYLPPGYRVMSLLQEQDTQERILIVSDGLFCALICFGLPGSRTVSKATVHPGIRDFGDGLVWMGYRGSLPVAVLADLPKNEIEKLANSIPCVP